MTTTRKINKWQDWQKLRARGRRIVRLRSAGLRWTEIASKLGMTKQRVYQVWKACEAGTGPYAGLI